MQKASLSSMLFLGCGLFLGVAIPSGAAQERSATPPNIVLIHCDDLRPDLLSVAGHPLIETPRIDTLAGEGVRFLNAFATSGTCSPSRASIWTGLYPHAASAPHITDQNNSFLETQTTLPQILQKDGFRTMHVGKWHMGRDEGPTRGFDDWYGWTKASIKDQVLVHNGQEEIPTKGFTDDAMADFAAELIENNAGKKPLFLSLGLRSPHRPFAYPDRLADRFKNDEIPKPETFDEDYAESGRDPFIQQNSEIHVQNSPFYKGFRTWDNYITSHYRSAESIDRNVGVVLDALKKAGIADNTLVILTSDHGYSLGEHGLVEKHFAHEEVMRVPLIMRWPGHLPPGGEPVALASLVDLTPTILEFAGLPVPPDMQGRSLKPVALAPDKVPNGWRDAVFFNYESRNGRIPGQNALRTATHKFVTTSRNRTELYDLVNDPRETRNVADAPAYADVLNELRARYGAYTERIGYRPRPTREPFSEIFVLRGLDEAAAKAVSESLAGESLDPSKPVQIGNREVRWEKVEANGQGKFAPADLNSEEGMTLIGIPVERLVDYDPHLAIWVTPWPRETSIFWHGRNLWTYQKKAGSVANPPLEANANTVLLGVEGIDKPITITGESIPDSLRFLTQNKSSD